MFYEDAVTMTRPLLKAAELRDRFERKVINALIANDFTKSPEWYAFNARLAFSYARIAAAEQRQREARTQFAREYAGDVLQFHAVIGK